MIVGGLLTVPGETLPVREWFEIAFNNSFCLTFTLKLKYIYILTEINHHSYLVNAFNNDVLYKSVLMNILIMFTRAGLMLCLMPMIEQCNSVIDI